MAGEAIAAREAARRGSNDRAWIFIARLFAIPRARRLYGVNG
jgi:hypothetical protein